MFSLSILYRKLFYTSAIFGLCAFMCLMTFGASASPVYNPANGHYYEVVNVSGLSWQQAEVASELRTYQGMRGHLVTITSAAENTFVFSLGNVVGYHFGAYQDTSSPYYSEPAGGWRWVTGELFTYTNWTSGEPNNGRGIPGNAENYMVGWVSNGWNDGGGRNESGFVVEYEKYIAASDPLDKTLGNPYDNSGGCSVGEPINVGTGNVYDEVMDYETAGANKLRFSRYYNSRVNAGAAVASLGRNWRSNYDRKIVIASNTSVTVIRADGQSLQFTWNGNAWVSDSDVSVKLTQSGTTWTLADTDDTVETYSPIGSAPVGFINQPLLKSIQARNGYTQTLQYDGSKLLSSVTDSYGRMLNFTFQGGLLQMVTTPDGLVLNFSYGSILISQGNYDRLASVSYANTNFNTPATKQSYQYTYASLPNALTAIIDENGNSYASWTYDQYGRGTSSQFGTGALFTKVAYNDNDGSRTVTSPLGLQEIYRFATMQGIPKIVEIDRPAAAKTFNYDSKGYLASETDWNGNTTTYTNDGMGRPTTIIEAAYTADARTTTISYFGNYHLAKHIVAPQLTTDYTFDASGNALTKTLTDTTTTTIPYKTNGQTRTWAYTWSPTGLLMSVQNPRTDVVAKTSFAYDGSGCLTKTTNALGQSVQVTQHSPGGLPFTVVDANNVTTQFAYDARLRLLGTAVHTSAGVLTTLYTYDPTGNLLTTTLPDGSALANAYDTAHRLTGVMNLFNQQIAYTLDAASNRTIVNILGGAGVVRQSRTYAFDLHSRLTMAQGGAGQKTRYTYDRNDNLLSITDPLSHTSAYVYDAFNRRIQTTNAANGVTEIDYDAQDHPLSVIDPNKANTVYVRNGFGDVIQKTSSDSGVTVYYYDANSNLTSKVDAAKINVNYAYDKLDRVISVTYPGNASENVTYTYDQTAGHGYGVGRLTAIKDAVGTLSRSYDERGNVVSETRVMNGSTLQTAYTFDKAGHVSSITYPSGLVVTYIRDPMGRATSITAKVPGAAVQPVVSSIGYQPFGPVNSLTFWNGIVETRSFDNDYRLTGIIAKGSKTLQSLTYGYDAGDNVLTIADAVASLNSQTFSYGTLDRVAQAKGVYGSLLYGNDNVGNRQTQTVNGTVTNYGYASNSNRLTSAVSGGVTQPVSYTATGNISAISVPGSNFMLAYNQSGRLASVTSGAKTIAQYGYDAFGKRLTKSTTTKTLFQYDLQNHLLEEGGSATTDYIYLDDGRPIATVSPSARSVYYLHCDRLGTPQLATNSAQSVVWSTAYMPFGQTGTVTGTITQNLRLPGQYFDSETGWYQNGFRDYVPALGRYLESDPTGLDGGLNTYAYVDGNPVKRIDSSGLCSTSTIGPNLLSYAGAMDAPLDSVYPVEWLLLFISGLGEAGVAAEGIEGTGIIGEANNALPSTLARVIPADADLSGLLGQLGRTDVFVTAADDIAGLSAEQIAPRLGIPNSPSGFRIYEFSTPAEGAASPVFRGDPGFIGRGLTSGGAREFVIPNGPIPQSTARIVR